MNKLFKTLLGLACATIAFSSCTKEVENPAQSDDYFPLKVGKYIVYNVDSIRYNPYNKETYHNTYQMRYNVVDSFLDNQGRVSFTINVYQRVATDSTFTPRDVIHVTKTAAGVEWTQSNAKIFKMVFPATMGTTWNGMTFIEPRQDLMAEYDLGKFNWNFHYSKVDAEFDPGNNPFYKTLTIDGIDEATNTPEIGVAYADRNYYQEIYAAGVGLVYRERIYWVWSGGDNPGQNYKDGYELRMRAESQN